MSIKFRSISGLDNTRLGHGLNTGEIPGEGGAGPNTFIIFLSASGLEPENPSISISLLSPTSVSATESGTDANGNISVTVTWVNLGDDKHFAQAGGGSGNFPDGFWNTLELVRGHLSVPTADGIEIDIQFTDYPVIDFAQSLSNSPDTPTTRDQQWNGSEGQVTLDVTLPNLSESPTSIAIARNGEVIANVPVTALNDYSFTDFVFASGVYDYEVFAYKYPNSRSLSSAATRATFGVVSSFEITGSGGFEFGGSAVIGFLVDPSGLYKLVIDKTHDTIYTNTSAGDDTENVAIP